MFGLGGAEIALILLFGFLIFGPDKLPAIARTIGRVVKQFRNAQEQMNKVIQAEVYDPLKDLEPLANPFSGIEDALTGKKPDAAKKTNAKTATSSSGSSVAQSTAKSADAAAKPATEKVSSDAMKAAIAAEAAKAKKQAKAKTEIQGEKQEKTSAADSESFAARRARLEQAHAESKTKQAVQSAATSPKVEE